MSMSDDKKLCLIEGMVKLSQAADLVRWALSGENAKVIPRDEAIEVAARLKSWAGLCLDAARRG